jgi:hypothetical protein
MCSEEEDALNILLKCSETRKWRKIVLSKWLSVNEKVAYEGIINCTNAVELRNIEIYLYKIRCKWDNKIKYVLFEMGRGG